jgi:phosphoribosylamine-glycine ligase
MAIDWEQKKIHGLGKAEGCLGNVVTFKDPKKQPYFKDYFSKLLPEITGGVATEWAINNIIEEDTYKPYFLEFTPRHGWDSTQGELALLEHYGRSIAEFYYRLAFKLPFPDNFFPYGKYSCTVRFYTGGIGMEPDEAAGKPIFWDKKYDKNLWWYSIKCRDDGEYETTGNPVGCAVFCGDTAEEAIMLCYDFLDPKKDFLTLPDIFYSENIGECVYEEEKLLKEWGIIK